MEDRALVTPAAGSAGTREQPVETGAASSTQQPNITSIGNVMRDTVSPSMSPLARAIAVWEIELQRVHGATCACVDACAGIRPLHEILAHDPFSPVRERQCLQATEAELLLHGIHHGFYVLEPHQPVDTVPPLEVDNYARDPIDLNALHAKIGAELEQGIIEELPTKPAHLTALFTKREADKIRPLKDYSAPKGRAVNDFADANKFTMMSLEDAYALMQPYRFMAKADVSDAFRTVGVHPKHRDLLTFKLRDPRAGQWRYYRETRFPMGLKCSPEIFCRLSQAVRAMMAARGYPAVVVYVDDFFIAADTAEQCQAALDMLIQLLQQLGFTVSHKKTVQPCQSIVFLGIMLETNYDGGGGMRITVPPEKMRKAASMAIKLSKASHISARELKQALGYFNHLAQAIFSARVYLRRLIAALQDNIHARIIPVTADMRQDLLWWACHAQSHNGTAIILQRPVMAAGFFATDASDWGMGGVLGDKTFSVAWEELEAAIPKHLPRRLRKYVKSKYRPRPEQPSTWWIDYREQFAMFFALLLWNEDLAGRHAALHCDNTVAQYTLNKGSAHALPMQALIRRMYRYMAAENIRVRVLRISSEANVLADCLSRKNAAGYAAARNQFQTPPPTDVWSPRRFSNPPLLEQAAKRYESSEATAVRNEDPPTQGDERHSPAACYGAARSSDEPSEDDVLLMRADCPALTVDEYHLLHTELPPRPESFYYL